MENTPRMPLSPDGNQERLDTLRQLFPDLFTLEGKLNPDELVKLVDPESVREIERYEFRWFGKSQAKRNAFTPTNATLAFDEQRSYQHDRTQNLIIEGDNLEVLKLLTAAYREQVKCIYIDPPYNTGSDFVYNDNFTTGQKQYWEDTGILENGVKIDSNTRDDGRYHSNWLNLLYPRLLAARQLLKPDGVIFISIDNHEIHHLRKITDEVFGEENFLTCLVWNLVSGPQAGHFTRSHEYVLAYAKSASELSYFEDESGGSILHSAIKKISSANPKSEVKFPAGKIEYEGGDKIFSGEVGDSEKQYLIDDLVFEKGILMKDARVQAGWAMKRQLESWLRGEETFDTKGQLVKRFYFNKQGILWYEKERGTSHPKTVIPSTVGNTKTGSESLESLLGSKVLDFPKPESLISFLIKNVAGGNSDDLIMDFFAGSGTTGHAVTELNKQDGGNRKYILVQLPEATDPKSEAHKAGYKRISDITIARNRKVAERIAQEAKELAAQQEQIHLQLSALQVEIDTYQNSHQTLPLEGAAVSKPLQKLLDKQQELQQRRERNQTLMTNIAKLDTGFQVFQLRKSNFPRVEFAPDPSLTQEQNVEALREYIRLKENSLTSLITGDLLTEVLLKNGFRLIYTKTKWPACQKNHIWLVNDGHREALVCLEGGLHAETIEYFKQHTDHLFICLERALSTTTAKYNLKHYLGDKLIAY